MKSIRLVAVALSLLLSHSFSSIYAVKFEWTQPLMRIYSFVPWQQVFNLGTVGALGWISHKYLKLQKSVSKCVTNESLQTSVNNGVASYAAANLQAQMGNHFATRGELEGVREQIQTCVTQEGAARDFVQKTKEANDELAKTLVSTALPIFNKQFVNINTFYTLEDQVNTCATKNELKDVETAAKEGILDMNKDFNVFKNRFGNLETEHNELQKSVITANTNILKLIQEQKTHSEELQKLITITTSLAQKIDALSTDGTFITQIAAAATTRMLENENKQGRDKKSISLRNSN